VLLEQLLPKEALDAAEKILLESQAKAILADHRPVLKEYPSARVTVSEGIKNRIYGEMSTTIGMLGSATKGELEFRQKSIFQRYAIWEQIAREEFTLRGEPEKFDNEIRSFGAGLIALSGNNGLDQLLHLLTQEYISTDLTGEMEFSADEKTVIFKLSGELKDMTRKQFVIFAKPTVEFPASKIEIAAITVTEGREQRLIREVDFEGSPGEYVFSLAPGSKNYSDKYVEDAGFNMANVDRIEIRFKGSVRGKIDFKKPHIQASTYKSPAEFKKEPIDLDKMPQEKIIIPFTPVEGKDKGILKGVVPNDGIMRYDLKSYEKNSEDKTETKLLDGTGKTYTISGTLPKPYNKAGVVVYISLVDSNVASE
ncbi:hypothetical protein HY772_02115, partial [Candidatus Woesearchaeota archaeon]|nr:hypothetical protein [Candidatus Woesearchaeota archaeon]